MHMRRHRDTHELTNSNNTENTHAHHPVAPFCELPLKVKRMNMVIVSIRATPYDKVATLKINAKCDDVMKGLMSALQLNVGDFTYKQQYKIGHRSSTSTSTSA